jgi:H+/Cl- antiporter ClcA
MNDAKDDAPLNQGQSPGWIVAKLVLLVPALGVVCVAFLIGLMGAINMAETCPDGLHVGHIPCDASIIFVLIGLFIGGLGIWLLRWIGRLETSLKQWRERLGRWRSSQPFARMRGSERE